MANLLQFDRDIANYDPYDEGEGIAESLFEHYQKSLQDKIIKEKGYWSDFDQARMDKKLKENS